MSVGTDAIDRLTERERRLRAQHNPGDPAYRFCDERIDALQEARSAVRDAEAEQFVGD